MRYVYHIQVIDFHDIFKEIIKIGKSCLICDAD